MRPLVSIIIPVFNGEPFLEKTLLSVQKQTYDNRQIIVVNDGSTDASAEIAAKYSLSDPRIQVITQRNRGVASARNYGLEHSSGEYVAFLDADDIWHPTKIERQIEVLLASTNSTGCGCVYALQRFIDVEDRVTGSGVFWSNAGAVSTHLVTSPVRNGSSVLTRRELALSVGGFDTIYQDFNAGGAEDLDFELKLAARFPIYVVSEYLVGYRSHESSMSSDRDRMLRATIAVFERHIRLNAALSKRSVNWARGQLYTQCLFNRLDSRHYVDALKMLARLAINDPALAPTQLLSLPRTIARQAFRAICGAVGFHPKLQRRAAFYEVDPLEIGPLPAEILRRRISYLAQEDAALLFARRQSELADRLHEPLGRTRG
jgi:glycosyltransferase involved in cell wall biosynthesis